MIKQFIFQTLLRTRYHVGYSQNSHWLRKYFWRLESARKFADKIVEQKTIVWRRDFKRMYISKPYFTLVPLHEDAKNFNTNI